MEARILTLPPSIQMLLRGQGTIEDSSAALLDARYLWFTILFDHGLTCAGMRWSVPELGTNLGTIAIQEEFRSGQLLENSGGQGRD